MAKKKQKKVALWFAKNCDGDEFHIFNEEPMPDAEFANRHWLKDNGTSEEICENGYKHIFPKLFRLKPGEYIKVEFKICERGKLISDKE